MRTVPHHARVLLLLAALATAAAGCGSEPAEPPAGRRRDRRGATPQETVALVKEALERRRYRDVLLHVVPEDGALFALGRIQALWAFAEGLEGEETPRRDSLLTGLRGMLRQHGIEEQALGLGHEDVLRGADPAALLDRLGALGASHSVDGLGGFADLVPELRDWRIEGDVATALSGEDAATERWTFRRRAGAWYYVARE